MTRIKAGRAPVTINRDISVLKSMFTKAIEWGHLSANPLAKLKPAKLDNGRVRYLGDDEEKRMLAALVEREGKIRDGRASANGWRSERRYPLLPDLSAVAFVDHLKPMALLSLHTGIRWGELVQLTWEHINLDSAVMTVLGRTANTGKTRHIPLNAIALGMLKSWKIQTGEATGLVFRGADGKVRNNIKKAWSNLTKSAQVNNFHWHDMRHDFASKLVMAGEDLNTVLELKGHADLKMALRYAHLSPENKASAVAKLVRQERSVLDIIKIYFASGDMSRFHFSLNSLSIENATGGGATPGPANPSPSPPARSPPSSRAFSSSRKATGTDTPTSQRHYLHCTGSLVK